MNAVWVVVRPAAQGLAYCPLTSVLKSLTCKCLTKIVLYIFGEASKLFQDIDLKKFRKLKKKTLGTRDCSAQGPGISIDGLCLLLIKL